MSFKLDFLCKEPNGMMTVYVSHFYTKYRLKCGSVEVCRKRRKMKFEGKEGYWVVAKVSISARVKKFIVEELRNIEEV